MASNVKNRQIVDDRFAELEAAFKQSPDKDGANTEIIRDLERGCFLIVRYGWRDKKRIRAVSLYVRVEDNRVFIEDDMTDWRIADRLIENGISPEDIVFAFQQDNPTAAETMNLVKA